MLIFISSTYQDLAVHRRTLEDSLAISGIDFNAMEHFGASPTPPIQTCLAAVEHSEIFVGILGVRYGASPIGGKQSYTKREYRRAKSLGAPVFMFLIDMDNATVAPALVANETREQQARMRRLKDFVLSRHTVSYFTTAEDLARLVLASLIRQFGVTT